MIISICNNKHIYIFIIIIIALLDITDFFAINSEAGFTFSHRTARVSHDGKWPRS